MSSARLQTPDTIDPNALAKRRIAVREGIASARIEGGDVGPEATQIMNDYAAGLIDKETMIERVRSLHEPD